MDKLEKEIEAAIWEFKDSDFQEYLTMRGGRTLVACIAQSIAEKARFSDEEIREHSGFLFKFFELGYDCAIKTLQGTRALVLNSKTRSMREYFEREAVKQGLIKEPK